MYKINDIIGFLFINSYVYFLAFIIVMFLSILIFNLTNLRINVRNNLFLNFVILLFPLIVSNVISYFLGINSIINKILLLLFVGTLYTAIVMKFNILKTLPENIVKILMNKDNKLFVLLYNFISLMIYLVYIKLGGKL